MGDDKRNKVFKMAGGKYISGRNIGRDAKRRREESEFDSTPHGG